MDSASEKLTPQQVAKMLAGHPDGSSPRIFEAALSGVCQRNDFLVQGPRDAVAFALMCVAELLDIEVNGYGDS